jgi:hypothetical protein
LVYPWRAVDSEVEVLDVLVQTKRDKAAALQLMRELLKKLPANNLATDDLRSYHAAARDLKIEHRRRAGRWRNTRAENSRHRPDDENARCKGSRTWGPGMRGLPFDRKVEALLLDRSDVALIVRPMLVAWRQLREQITVFDKSVRMLMKSNSACPS